jgi:hypothetical protein
MLRRISGPKREEVRRGWRKLCEELHDLYSSNIVMVIKYRRIRWMGHAWERREIHTYFSKHT